MIESDKINKEKRSYRKILGINLISVSHSNSHDIYYLFNVPIIKIKKKSNYKKVMLLGFLPLFRLYNNFNGFRVNLARVLLFWFPFPSLKRKFINYLLSKRCSIKLNGKNFTPFDFDDTVLLNELRQLDHFTYIGNPGNLGDCLIAKATYDFFEKHNLKYDTFKGKAVKNIVYGGGGIWIKELYASTYRKILKIMSQAERIIILPSSIYDCPDLINILDHRFVVFCREKQSFDYVMSFKTKAKVILDHDMALRATSKMLEGQILITPERKSLLQKMTPILNRIHHVVAFLRNDAEKANSHSSDYDLSLAFGSRLMSKDDVNFATMLMLSVIDLFETIITDRLHVAIAATLMGKEVYMLDNSYRKLSMVYQNSLLPYKNIHLCSKFPKDIKAGSASTDNFYNILKAL